MNGIFRFVCFASAVAWGLAGCGGDSGNQMNDDGGVVDAAAPAAAVADTAVPDAQMIDAAPGLPLGANCGVNPSTDAGVDAGTLRCADGLLCCTPCCDGRPAVCTAPTPPNAANIGVGQCPLPDLAVDATRLQAEVGLGPTTFGDGSCSVDEGCTSGPGTRKLLHFSVVTPNLGTSDLHLGSPQNNPRFTFATCHNHYHFAGYALYRLLDGSGNEVLQGRKRAFCLEDFEPQDNPPLGGRTTPRYTCQNQGISMGWIDTYANGLTCQFIDITGVPAGRYTLQVSVNPDHYFEELRYDNNVATATIDIPADFTDPVQPCMGRIEGIQRECGYTNGGTFTCTPGTSVRAGCGSRCNVGGATCSGDTIMRICDGATTAGCTWPGLGTNDDCAGGTNCSAVSFTCPTSGQYTVLWAPFETTGTATCNVAHIP